MEYEFKGQKLELGEVNDKSIEIIFWNGKTPASKTIEFSQWFEETGSNTFEGEEEIEQQFMDDFRQEIRNLLPEDEEYDDFEKMQGYWECMGVAQYTAEDAIAFLYSKASREEATMLDQISDKLSEPKAASLFSKDEIKLMKGLIAFEQYRLDEDSDDDL